MELPIDPCIANNHSVFTKRSISRGFTGFCRTVPRISYAGINKSGNITPLFVIVSFLAITEVVALVDVPFVSGGVQVTLTVFVVIFPVLVLAAFFVILWYRNWLFYPPSEYPEGMDPREYAEAMQWNMSRARATQVEQIGKLFQDVRGTTAVEEATNEAIEATDTFVREVVTPPELRLLLALTNNIGGGMPLNLYTHYAANASGFREALQDLLQKGLVEQHGDKKYRIRLEGIEVVWHRINYVRDNFNNLRGGT